MTNRGDYHKRKEIKELVEREFAETGLSRNSEEGRQVHKRLYQKHYGRAFRKEYQKKWYAERTPEQKRDKQLKQIEFTNEIKTETIAKYGGKCVCCGETNIEFLSIDHVNKDGMAHRETLVGRDRRAGARFYIELKRLGYPNDPPLVVLCMNCNAARGSYGYCPHEELSDVEKLERRLANNAGRPRRSTIDG
jgi:5-methylcytosine-specific restriction endonuclease McrA